MKQIEINGNIYSQWHPYIIAEIGVNHSGDLGLAFKMIEQAAKAGAHAVKFQTYKAEKIASKDHSKYYWDLTKEPSTSQFDLFKKYDSFDAREYQQLKEYADKLGVEFLSTPFDLESVDMLDPLVPFFKIASADITNVPLLRKVANKNKLIVLSTGASTLGEIETALDILKSAGANEVCLLHCVLNYPTENENAQIGYIETLKRIFPNNVIGYSDHVKPEENSETIPALFLATTLGAVVLEKHFTYDKSLTGNDHYHSMDMKDLKKFCESLSIYRSLFGGEDKNLEIEKRARDKARRRICASKAVSCGDVFSENNLIALRADVGIPIERWDEIIGQRSSVDINVGEPLTWDSVEQ